MAEGSWPVISSLPGGGGVVCNSWKFGTGLSTWGSRRFVFILWNKGPLGTSRVSTPAITSFTFLDVDLVLGLVTTLLWAVECKLLSLGLTLSSRVMVGGGGDVELRSQVAERFLQWFTLLDRASRLPASWRWACTRLTTHPCCYGSSSRRLCISSLWLR